MRRGDGEMVERRRSVRSACVTLALRRPASSDFLCGVSLRRTRKVGAERFQEDAHPNQGEKGALPPPAAPAAPRQYSCTRLVRALKKISKEINSGSYLSVCEDIFLSRCTVTEREPTAPPRTH